MTGNAIHIKAGSKAILQGGTSLSVKAGAGVITLGPSGVAIMEPLVRINEGGGGGSAQAANPIQPGNPAEADNDAPGAKLRVASAGYSIYDAATNELIKEGTLDSNGCARTQLPLDKTNIRVEYHGDPAPAAEIKPTTAQQIAAPDGWLQRMMQNKGKESGSD